MGFIILGEPHTPRGKLIFDERNVILNVYDLAFLYLDLILEYFALRLKLPHVLIIFCLGYLVLGGLLCGSLLLGLGFVGVGRVAAIAYIVVPYYLDRRGRLTREP